MPHSSRTATHARTSAFCALAGILNRDDRALDLLLGSWSPAGRVKFEALLAFLICRHNLAPLEIYASEGNTKPAFDRLVEVVLADQPGHDIPDAIKHVAQQYQRLRNRYRRVHKIFARNLGLTRETGADWYNSLPTVEAESRNADPYPACNYHISESAEITAKWRTRFHHGPLPDTRRPRRFIREVDESQLSLVVHPDESCKIVDKATKQLIAVVIRGFTCGGETSSSDEREEQSGFLAWALASLEDGIVGRRSIRLEDAGKLVQTGYSAGSRSAPCFNWVRNVLPGAHLTPDFIATSDYRLSATFAVLWNAIRARLPPEIMDSWLQFNEETQLPRMDGGIRTTAAAGDVRISLGDDDVVFRGAELAPACGMVGQNYARVIHRERQPKGLPWAISWTAHRSQPTEAGGHFYIASYGIKIENCSDTLIAWQPYHWHGTSLANLDPADPNPDFQQVGLSFVMASRLPSVFKKYRAAFQAARVHRPFGAAEDQAAAEAAWEFLREIADAIEEDLGGEAGGEGSGANALAEE